MKKITLAVSSVVVFTSLATSTLADQPLAGNVAAGMDLANKGGGSIAPCASCHGTDGAGMPASNFPRIAGYSEYYLRKQLEDFHAGTRKQPLMQPTAYGLNDQQIADLAVYYASLPTPPFPDVPQVDAAVLERGEQLAERGSIESQTVACANCHGPLGTGLPPAIPALAGQSSGYIAAQLKAWQSGDRSNDEGGLMAAVAGQLNDEDIAAVSAYYSAVRPDALEP